MADMASTMSTPMGASVSCSGVRSPKMLTVGPSGITEKATNAGIAARTGARADGGRGAGARLAARVHAPAPLPPRPPGRSASLGRDLRPGCQALQRAARAAPVGAEPLLHA